MFPQKLFFLLVEDNGIFNAFLQKENMILPVMVFGIVGYHYYYHYSLTI